MKKPVLFMVMSCMLVLVFSPVNGIARNEQHRSSVRQRPDPGGSYKAQRTQSIPEPSSLLLLASSGGILYCLRRYLKK